MQQGERTVKRTRVLRARKVAMVREYQTAVAGYTQVKVEQQTRKDSILDGQLILPRGARTVTSLSLRHLIGLGWMP